MVQFRSFVSRRGGEVSLRMRNRIAKTGNMAQKRLLEPFRRPARAYLTLARSAVQPSPAKGKGVYTSCRELLAPERSHRRRTEM